MLGMMASQGASRVLLGRPCFVKYVLPFLIPANQPVLLVNSE